MGEFRLLSNTHAAIAAAEFARDEGSFERFHEALFQAYFVEGRDIGDRGVIAGLAAGCGLEPARMDAAMEGGTYDVRLAAVRREAANWLLQGVPTFIVNGEHKIVGAQPLDTFRSAADRPGLKRPGGRQPLAALFATVRMFPASVKRHVLRFRRGEASRARARGRDRDYAWSPAVALH